MATSTPNYGLYKYGGDDSPDLTALGPTMDKIDTELKKNATNIGSLNVEIWMSAADNGNPLNAISRSYSSFPANRSLGIVVIGGAFGASVFAMGLKSSETYGAFIAFGYFTSPKFFRVIDGVWSESDI